MPRCQNSVLLLAANAQLKAAKGNGKITLKVSEKGAVSVYGLGRFPITLYKGQWERLLDNATVEQVKAFIVVHEGELSTKDAPKGKVEEVEEAHVEEVKATPAVIVPEAPAAFAPPAVLTRKKGQNGATKANGVSHSEAQGNRLPPDLT